MRRTALRAAPSLALVAMLAAASRADAREAASVDDDERPEAEMEELGPRGNLHAHADGVAFDARGKTIELRGNVRLDAAPFHLRSDDIRLTRTRYGLEIDGKGSLAFCPCLGTPLTVDFDHAIVAPPGDLVLTDPKLRVYGVPVLWLPYFWLRSDEKVGVLPPDLAYRGQDGLFVGDGVHLPWKTGAGRSALDVRAGAYVLDGFAVDTRLRTPSSFTKVRYDRLPGAPAPALPSTGGNADDGLVVDARGATRAGEVSVAWDVDALRGRRGVAMTTELDSAAKPWDRASGEGALRVGPVVLAEGYRVVSRRGGGVPDFDAAGPVTSLRVSGAATSGITYDATVEGGALHTTGVAVSPDTVTYVRAELGALAATSLGPFAASLAARGAGDVAAESQKDGADRAAIARAHVGVPLARRYGDEPDATVHVVEPFVEAAALHAHGDGLLEVLPGRGAASAIDGTAPMAEAGVTTALGRWGRRESVDLTLAGGAAFGDRDTPSSTRALTRARAAATLAWLGLSADVASVMTMPSGIAGIGRARVGASDGLRLLANVAARDGIDPVLARLLSDAPLEPPAGLLAAIGTTGGASFVVPWSHAVTTSVGADADATHGELVAARAGLELRGRCGCVTLHANGAHRIGRAGVDVWLALDFASDR